MNTPSKIELQNYLNNVPQDFPVYISCAYNRYQIKRLIVADGYILLDAGEIDNPDEEMTNDFEDDAETDDGPMVA